ncbi:hypothetical protein GCM10011514_43320 [Emticicia aquatilis]|uniref:DUF115 domain-containing protein n=1 Tax=Emticicia aquatilis TaxID=1537369 RepID=A0A916Z3S4_9BACT|nr:hypothetical protein [Emticicia aquatilis]GGD74609.1 hypothetical protein GCM10011514_43320 [Emticicia aquatilis]
MLFDYYIKTGAFFENSLQSVVSLVKVILLSKLGLPKFSNQKPNASILGNGPSLNQALSDNLDFLKETDIYCVNLFALSAVYASLKPQNYVLLDPAFFMFSEQNDGRQDIKKTFDAIIQQTDWAMRLFVPARSKNSYIVKKLKQERTNIQICFFNYTIVRGFPAFRHWFFKHNLGMPQCQNILAASLYVALLQDYKNVYLFGADHSWHEEIRITEQNEFEMRQVHFYDNANNIKHEKVIDVRNNSRPSLQAQFLSLHKVFYSYEILGAFAKYRKIKVLNASKKTYIDAFERVTV